MNEETNDSGIHTWVDLLNSEETSGSSDGSRSRRVKISSHTPRSDRTASRLTGQAVHREAGQAEGLRAQIMALLKEKQEMRKKVCNDVQIVCCYVLTTWKMIVMAMCVCVCVRFLVKMEAEKSHRQRLELELAGGARRGIAYKVCTMWAWTVLRAALVRFPLSQSPIPVVTSITKNGSVPQNGLESSSMEIRVRLPALGQQYIRLLLIT